MENTEQRGLRMGRNGQLELPISIGPVQPRKVVTSKGGAISPKLLRLDLTDQFRPRFPEILVEWIAPYILEGITQNWAGYFARCVNHSMDGIWSAVFPVCDLAIKAIKELLPAQ